MASLSLLLFRPELPGQFERMNSRLYWGLLQSREGIEKGQGLFRGRAAKQGKASKAGKARKQRNLQGAEESYSGTRLDLYGVPIFGFLLKVRIPVVR